MASSDDADKLVLLRAASKNAATTSTIFISYAREDKIPALKLHSELLRSGVQPWIDCVDLMPGQLWPKEIRRAISRSSYFLALLSSRSVIKRGHVQKELRYAIDVADEYPEDQIFIIPVRLDECEPPFERLNQLHRLDLFPDYERGLDDLLRVLKYEMDEKPELTHVEAFPRQGEIKQLTTRGFGYISSALIEKNIFFHHSELRGITFEELSAGVAIVFHLAQLRTILVAKDVSRL